MTPGTCDARHEKKNTSPIHRHDPVAGNNMLGHNFYRRCGADDSRPTGPDHSGPAQALFQRPWRL